MKEKETGPLYEYYKQVFSMSIAFQAVTTQENKKKNIKTSTQKGEKRHKKQKVIRVVVTGIRARG